VLHVGLSQDISFVREVKYCLGSLVILVYVVIGFGGDTYFLFYRFCPRFLE